jgi:hypothetical protein
MTAISADLPSTKFHSVVSEMKHGWTDEHDLLCSYSFYATLYYIKCTHNGDVCLSTCLIFETTDQISIKFVWSALKVMKRM